MDTGTVDVGVWKSAPGKGRKTPKGRQVSDTAISEVQLLLGNRPREQTRKQRLLVSRLRMDNYSLCTVLSASGLDV